MTLIETMVAMTISSVLILGSIQMYSQARSNYRTVESVARMQENLRFSIDILDEDLRLAGFWGKTSVGDSLEGEETINVTCDANVVSNWVMQPDTPIEAIQQGTPFPNPGCQGTDRRMDSDVLIVRHAEPDPNQTTVATPGVVQVQSNGTLGMFFDNGAAPLTASLNGEIFDVTFSAYYVSDRSKYDATLPALPALRRLSLVGNRLEDQEIVPGVENLQVQFGLDTDDDGLIDRYVDGDNVDPSDTIISTRLWLLVRSERNEVGQGFIDTKGPYRTPDDSNLQVGPTLDAALYPPTFRRMALSRTVMLRNRQSPELN